MKLGDIIKENRMGLGMTMDELANKSGLSKGYISMLEKGENPKTKKQIIPSVETFKRLSHALGLDINELINTVDADQKILLAREASAEYNTKLRHLTPIPHKKQIPILGHISAGLPLLAVEHIEAYENVEDESLDYGLIVKGDSMIGANIYEGYTVYVSRETDICNGDIVIALINGYDATIKRFYRYDNEIILKPENPTMKEQHYKPEDVQLLGKVKQVRFNL